MPRQHGTHDAKGASSPHSSATKGKDVIYTCPMHPEIQQPGPGSCPKCGMTLEPKMVT